MSTAKNEETNIITFMWKLNICENHTSCCHRSGRPLSYLASRLSVCAWQSLQLTHVSRTGLKSSDKLRSLQFPFPSTKTFAHGNIVKGSEASESKYNPFDSVWVWLRHLVELHITAKILTRHICIHNILYNYMHLWPLQSTSWPQNPIRSYTQWKMAWLSWVPFSLHNLKIKHH